MRFSLTFLFFFQLICASSQTHKYFIRFTDKNNSIYSVSRPAEFLSQRAIDRRNNQRITISSRDLPVNENYIDSIVSKGAAVFTRSKWFNGVTIECDSATLTSILSLPFVSSSQQVYRKGRNVIRKNAWTGFPLNYSSLLRVSGGDYGASYNQIHLMNGEYLHEQNFRGEGRIIALLDAGFYRVDSLSPFQHLRDNDGIISTHDFVNNESSVYEDDTHGMSVLSCIAGYVPGMLVGTAPEARFLLLRSEDASTENIIEEYNWDAAAEYADSAGADVISTSLGYTQFDDTTASHTYADMDGDHCPSSIAADIAASCGMLVIASAGNSGVNPWHYIGAPSDGDSVISVAATDSMGRQIFFSSFGPAPDGRIKPNVAAKGYASTLADASGSIVQGSGTSFACPILAGSATCLWQAFPNATAMEVKEAIERSANLFHHPNDSMGYGIPDFRLAAYLLSTGNAALPSDDEVISVYPNPFTENVTVRFYSSSAQIISLKIFNTTGQLIYSKENSVASESLNDFVIDIPRLSNGLYFIKVQSKEKSFINKVIH